MTKANTNQAGRIFAKKLDQSVDRLSVKLKKKGRAFLSRTAFCCSVFIDVPSVDFSHSHGRFGLVLATVGGVFAMVRPRLVVEPSEKVSERCLAGRFVRLGRFRERLPSGVFLLQPRRHPFGVRRQRSENVSVHGHVGLQ